MVNGKGGDGGWNNLGMFVCVSRIEWTVANGGCSGIWDFLLNWIEGGNEIVEWGPEIIVVLLMLKRSIPKYTSVAPIILLVDVLPSPNPISLHHTIPDCP